MAGRGKFSDGSARESAVASSVVPVASSMAGVMMSIGAVDDASVRSLARVPVTITTSSVLGPSLVSCATAGIATMASIVHTTEYLRFMKAPQKKITGRMLRVARDTSDIGFR